MVATLSYDLLTEFLSFLRVQVDTEPGDLNILALQGAVPYPKYATMGKQIVPVTNTPDLYNDSIILIYRDDDGNKHVEALLGTVDPGKYYTVVDPNPNGAAHLTFGQHLYTKGIHRGHPALRSLNEINRVWRDRNGNFNPDVGEMVFVGSYGVNIHAGGTSTTSIGKNSAGCLTIFGGYSGAPYKKFLEAVDNHSENKKAIRVTVWRGSDFFKYYLEGAKFNPTLLLGIQNPWVAEMQMFLKKKGYSVSVDGDWRQKTTEVLVKFQKDNGLTPDGWCGPKTWEKLLK